MGLLDQYKGKKLEGTPLLGGVQQVGGLLGNMANVAVQNMDKRNKTISRAWDMPNDEQAQKDAYAATMEFAGLAPLGMTAWHGSPHKFDKFSLDKIGTGEGAQAYGHGLYLAEAKDVGEEYAKKLGNANATMRIDGKPFTDDLYQSLSDADRLIAQEFTGMPKNWRTKGELIDSLKSRSKGAFKNWKPTFKEAIAKAKSDAVEFETPQYLYKTDIPDEAVARFLDWDKPLSQQAPEVQKLLEPLGYSSKAQVSAHDDALMAALMGDGSAALPKISDPMGSDIARGGGLFDGPDQVRKAQRLRELGIPGIRYLDGGSRSAGAGSSNFVAFDPEMIRILERNGQATGLQPWKPGEYGLLNP